MRMKIIEEGLKKQGLRCKYCGNFIWVYWDRKSLQKISGSFIIKEERIGTFLVECDSCESVLRIKK